MSDQRELTIAVGVNDRTWPLLAGLTPIEGVRPRYVTEPLETIFARAFDEVAYDVTELSASNYLYLSQSGACPYVALPIFPSRAFRHGAIYIRTDKGIAGPRDLAGRVVGVREYSMTAALVARGVLEDEFGLRAQDVLWRYGRVYDGDPQPIARMQPAGVDLKPIADGETLSDLLADGQIDALVAYKPPPVFLDGHQNVRRLFPNAGAVERDYARRTGHFPIMHFIGIRRDLAEEDPALALKVCAAFEEARRYTAQRIGETQASYTMLPWGASEADATAELMGRDWWSYGFSGNEGAVTALCRYAHAQGMTAAQTDPRSLFFAPSLDWTPGTN